MLPTELNLSFDLRAARSLGDKGSGKEKETPIFCFGLRRRPTKSIVKASPSRIIPDRTLPDKAPNPARPKTVASNRRTALIFFWFKTLQVFYSLPPFFQRLVEPSNPL